MLQFLKSIRIRNSDVASLALIGIGAALGVQDQSNIGQVLLGIGLSPQIYGLVLIGVGWLVALRARFSQIAYWISMLPYTYAVLVYAIQINPEMSFVVIYLLFYALTGFDLAESE